MQYIHVQIHIRPFLTSHLSEVKPLSFVEFQEHRRSCVPNWLLTTAVCSTYLCPKIWRPWLLIAFSWKGGKGENGWNEIELQFSRERSLQVMSCIPYTFWGQSWKTLMGNCSFLFCPHVTQLRSWCVYSYLHITCIFSRLRWNFCPQKHRLASWLKTQDYFIVLFADPTWPAHIFFASGPHSRLPCRPYLQELYKTVWEIKQKVVLDMAADRGPYIDQSQSLYLGPRSIAVDTWVLNQK